MLILEDNPVILGNIAFLLQKIETAYPVQFNPVSFPTVQEAKQYIREQKPTFDIILLDRNDKSGDSFHTIDLETLGIDKIISISSVPRNNEEARARGISKVVLKRYDELEIFTKELEAQLIAIVRNTPTVRSGI